MKAHLSLPAETDIQGIWNYIAQSNRAAADRVEQSIHASIEELAEKPNLGHFRDDVAPRIYRFHRVYSYLIIYKVEEDKLTVMRVIHGARDLPRVF
jgi:toxin ParE1/3/4